MAAAGGEANLAKHYRETSFFGIVQVLKNLRTINGRCANAGPTSRHSPPTC